MNFVTIKEFLKGKSGDGVISEALTPTAIFTDEPVKCPIPPEIVNKLKIVIGLDVSRNISPREGIMIFPTEIRDLFISNGAPSDGWQDLSESRQVAVLYQRGKNYHGALISYEAIFCAYDHTLKERIERIYFKGELNFSMYDQKNLNTDHINTSNGNPKG